MRLLQLAQFGLVMLTIGATLAPAASITTSVISGGGQRVTSGSYVIDGTIGDLGGISSVSSVSSKSGYAGQLTEVTSVTVTAIPSSAAENSTTQLSGKAVLDDSTITVLNGSAITWNSPASPIASINGNGLATLGAVYQDTFTAFSGSYLGLSATGQVLVLNTVADNYGTYAGDGIADDWQVQYFGVGNPDAGPKVDVDGTGQNNLFKYIAGLDPTNPASIFTLQINPVPSQPSRKELVFQPITEGRTYTVESTSNLVTVSYFDLTNLSAPQTNGTQVTIQDLGATQELKVYRVRISKP